MVRFAYSLKFICNPQISVCSKFVGIVDGAEQRRICIRRPACSQLTGTRLSFSAAAATLQTGPFGNLFSATFSTFLCFVLVISAI